jgi:DNA-directed RNA polymerase specialized sigma24 family protein
MITAKERSRVTEVTVRELFFTELYENCYPIVARFVKRNNGTQQDAKDIFQDALIIFYEKTLEKNLLISVSDGAYILGIAKHLWLKKFSKDKKTISLNEMEATITIPGDYFPETADFKIMNFLEQVGRKCMDLLTAFYYHKESMKEIKKLFGYSSQHTATVQKYKCLEKIRNSVKAKSITYHDFLE